MPEGVQVEGLPELRKALKELGDIEATREFKQAGFNVMTKTVVPHAQARASSLGPMQARAAETLRPTKVVTGGAVRFGAGFAGAFGAEFGAGRNVERNTRRGVVHGWNQFKPWRGSGEGAGYFLYPTLRDDAAEIVDQFDHELEPLYRRLYPEGG